MTREDLNKVLGKDVETLANSRFADDFETPLNINGNRSTRGMWNLILLKGEVRLYSKGIKPSRHWKITQVKDYLGMTGNAETILRKLEAIHDYIKANN